MRKIKTLSLNSMALALLTAALAACGTVPLTNGNVSNGDAPADVSLSAITPVVVPTNEVVILHSNVSNSPYPYKPTRPSSEIWSDVTPN
jgi:hypothetical protein